MGFLGLFGNKPTKKDTNANAKGKISPEHKDEIRRYLSVLDSAVTNQTRNHPNYSVEMLRSIVDNIRDVSSRMGNYGFNNYRNKGITIAGYIMDSCNHLQKNSNLRDDKQRREYMHHVQILKRWLTEAKGFVASFNKVL